MANNREINVCIWLASLVLYWWIKGGGAEAEVAWAQQAASDVWHYVIPTD